MKKIVLLLILGLTLTGCIQKNVDEPQNLLETVQQRGELIVATSPDYAPFEFIDPSRLGQSQYVGADIELAQAIADEIGVDLVIKAMNFEDIPSAISNYKYDIGISGFSYAPDRAKVIDFSKSYDSSESECQGFLVRSDNDFDSLEDFDQATVTSQNGSLQQLYTQEQLPNANKRTVTSLEDGLLELKTNRTDAVAISCASGQAFMQNNDDVKLSEVLFEISDELGTMAILPKGETELMEMVNVVIEEVKESGQYAQWLVEYTALSEEVSNMGEIKPNIITLFKEYAPLFWEGTLGTLWLSLIVVALGTLFGGLLAMIKMSKVKILSWLSSGYIEIVRGTPILLQLYLFVYGGAQLISYPISDTAWVILALIFNSSAYVAEVFRAGISAVDKGQFEASKSLGLSDKNMMIKVILPQAIKNILPALGNEFVTMIKETSLASIFFINSLMTTQSIVSSATHMKFETLIIVGIIYFILTFSLSKVISYFEKKGERIHA